MCCCPGCLCCYCCLKRPLICSLILLFVGLALATAVGLAIWRTETVVNELQRWIGVGSIRNLIN